MTNKIKKTPEDYFSWKANLPTNIPIFFAVFGIIYAITVLYYPGDTAYRDLYLFNKRELVGKVIQNRIDRLQWKVDSLKKYENPCAKTDSGKVKNEALKKIREVLASSSIELTSLDYFNMDTSLKFYSRYFSADRDTFLNALRKNKYEIPVLTRDTFATTYDFSLLKDVPLKLCTNRKKTGIVNYFDKYPLMGFWFFLSIAQSSLWFLLIPLIIGTVRKSCVVVPGLPYNIVNGLFFSIIPLVIVCLFTYMFYIKVVNSVEFLIDNSLFLNGFNTRMAFYGAPGYFVVIICLGIYIFLGNKLELLNRKAEGKDITKEKELLAQFLSLKTAFDFAFLCSAIILSVFVLWLGILFNTILSGKAFLNNDFVYLTGMLHTLILLIFYIPVRAQFNSLPITQQLKSANEDPNPNRVFKPFWDAISAVLITASPLITTVLQKLITGLVTN
jgi:hypothetical protein